MPALRYAVEISDSSGILTKGWGDTLLAAVLDVAAKLEKRAEWAATDARELAAAVDEWRSHNGS